MKSVNKVLIALTTASLAMLSPITAGSTILTEDWSAYTDGAHPSGGWEVRNLNGGSASVISQPKSAFSNTGNTLLLSHTDKTTIGPALKGTFSDPFKGPLQITFDFMLEGICHNQPTLVLSDSLGTKGVYLCLNNFGQAGIPGHNIINYHGGMNAELIAPLHKGIWHRVEININPSKSTTYSVKVTTLNGIPVVKYDLPYRNPIKNIASMDFMGNAATGEGDFYIANIQLSIPE
jgi:hypothetical protein